MTASRDEVHTAPPPSALTHLECSACARRHDAGVLQRVCDACGRPLLSRYDPDAARATFSRQTLATRPPTLARYGELLPLRDPAAAVTLGEGTTPLLAASRLAKALGLERLFVKDEGRNPTGTFKDRGAAVAVSRALELGVREFAVPTAGNAGLSLAAYAARAGVPAHVAMPRDAPDGVIRRVRAYGADLQLVDGLIGDAGALIAAGARDHGWFDISTLREPYRLEGKKTMGFELWEQLDGRLPHVIVYPTGGGTGLIGIWKAFGELEQLGLIDARRTRMVAVQAEGCAPIVRAFDAGAERAEPWEGAHTAAQGIRVPAPFADDLILRTLHESGGDAIAVSEGEIVDAQAELVRLEGIDACAEGAATLAGLRRLLASGRIERSASVVLLNTGAGASEG